MPRSHRLLTVDIDGTLVDSHGEVPDRNRAALRAAHEAGLRVCLCTGRSLAETRSVLDRLDLDLDAAVLVFGAIVWDLREHRTLLRSHLPTGTAARLVRFFTERRDSILLLFDVSEGGVDYRLVQGDGDVEAYEGWIRRSPAVTERIEAWTPEIGQPIRIGVIQEPCCIAETMQALGREFSAEEVKYNAIYAPNYGFHVVECFAPQVSKWHGIGHLLRLWGITPAEVVAVGDDINDVEMIAGAGLGVAMGNAIDAVRAVAKWRVPTNDECGVAVLVDALLSGKAPSDRE
ncbi:MAG TPA: HAD-IIB family hydrolase [Phycisphaerae bacterium]|nr:HAD-IIB family hydrolase [Phycisphaerae bacterium]